MKSMWSFKQKKENISHLVVGLGNPGEKYNNTAHNVGFRVVKKVREEQNFPPFSKDKYLKSEVSRNENTVLLLPQTFMNLSGEAVEKAVKRFNPEKITVVHDEADIPSGEVRLSFDSGSAGHKGVQSVIDHLKSKKFYRIRVGVRETHGKARGIILKNISSDTRKGEDKAIEELINVIEKPEI